MLVMLVALLVMDPAIDSYATAPMIIAIITIATITSRVVIVFFAGSFDIRINGRPVIVLTYIVKWHEVSMSQHANT